MGTRNVLTVTGLACVDHLVRVVDRRQCPHQFPRLCVVGGCVHVRLHHWDHLRGGLRYKPNLRRGGTSSPLW
jgi:hypothetical protein